MRLRLLYCTFFCLFALCLASPGLAAAPSGGQPGQGGQAGQGGPLPHVVVRPVRVGDITERVVRYARVEAIRQVQLANRVEGALDKWLVEPGSYVKKDQQLLEVDRAIYAARLASAQAEVEKAEVARDRARLEEARITRLLRSSAVAEAERDTALANLKGAEATLKAALAARDLARINLDYTHISAPFDGQIGTFRQHTGSFLTAHTTVCDIVQLDPIRVVFSLTETEALMLMRGQATGVAPRVSTHYLELPDGSIYAKQGELEYMDNKIDPQTGMATVRARFPNPERLLLPGQFVSLVTYQGVDQKAPLVPLGSLLMDARGAYVLLVDEKSAVERRDVKIRNRTGTHAVIESGLEGGELLIVDGIQKVRPGRQVDVTNAGPEEDGTGAPAAPIDLVSPPISVVPPAPANAGSPAASGARP